jgi:hypothetical protein
MNRDDFDRRWDRDVSREPTWRGPTRPVIPLSYAGTVAVRFGTHGEPSRCSTCHKPSAALRCSWCQDNDAQLCPCGSMTVATDPNCDDCGAAREAA